MPGAVDDVRRIRRALIAGQVFAGIGLGSAISVGSLLAAHIAGGASAAGLAATMSTLGSAVAAIPLARVAMQRGRRLALTIGASIAIFGASLIIVAGGLMSLPLVLLGLLGLGVGGAVNLQARFAVTDYSSAENRGRDLSMVVWATTVGAIIGPNLNGIGVVLGDALGMPELTGPFIFTVAAQLAAASIYWRGIGPNVPTVTVTRTTATAAARLSRSVPFAIAVIGLGHATMVAVMAMTPIHLVHDGASVGEASFVISLHVAGMYALSPVFGIVSDKLGRVPVLIFGQVVLAISLAMTAFLSTDPTMVTIGLILLGLGWSANTVAGSALVGQLSQGPKRLTIQGRSDAAMSASGALAGVLAGPAVTALGYSGLSFAAFAFVAAAGALIALIVTLRSRESAE
ncbi:MAG: MFS transporter [Microbacteriaceae bacterium]|nr:MFS transporter [Microbacteriaceae bacterium]